MPTPQTQRSIPEVLQNILGNLQEIVRSEFRLAKVEIKEEVAKAAKPAATFAVGLAAGFYGIGFLLLASVYGLSRIMADWQAALLIGAVLALIGFGLLNASGKKLKRVTDKTTQSVEENVQWAKHQVK